MRAPVRAVLITVVLLLVVGAVQGGSVEYLASVQDRFHQTYDVYSDADAAGNHFAHRGMISDPSSSYRVPDMAERTTTDPARGLSCLRASFGGAGATWGGWYFLNGVLQGNDTVPRPNWGTVPDAGLDLRGATTLTFQARGEVGGERVEVLALGVGRDAVTGDPIAPHPDSSRRISTGYVTLTRDWREYTIDVSAADLSYVLGGFGWVSALTQNDGQPIAFYLDEIRYNLPRLDEPRFLQSYRTVNSAEKFDRVMTNAAYSYDNAVALLAFLAQGGDGGRRRAGLIADAFVYAQDHDRFYTDGRIRNAYQAGDLALWPGWTPNGVTGAARMPGWWSADRTRWDEDAGQVGTSAGNVAWTGLALLAYHEATGGPVYLRSAERLGDWVLLNCADPGRQGFAGGYEGWEPSQTRLTYRSTEHNMDLYALFTRLYGLTREARWREAAESARGFVLSMWDPVDGKFWTGTLPDGTTVNTAFVPLDAQAWSIQAMGDAIPRADLERALQYAETRCRAAQGYDFDTDGDGIWMEGTGQMAVSYRLFVNHARSEEIVQYLRSVQQADGGVAATLHDGLTTGIVLSDGSPWVYYNRTHIAATGWLTFAETGMNPFYFTITPPLRALPGADRLPVDPNGDGRYEDVNGNVRMDFADVVLYFNQMSWIAANEPIAAFDYTANGRIDFADVVRLFDRL